MNYKVRIDWLSLTGKMNDDEGDNEESFLLACVAHAKKLLFGLGIKKPTLQTVSAARYYALSLFDVGSQIRINFGENLHTQGYQIIFSGVACNEYDGYDLLRGFVEIWRLKVTRLDVAVDLIDTGIIVADVADDYRKEHGDGHGKSWSFIKGKSGDTCYVGSRASQRMVRVYDKGGEQGINIDWIRCEIEYKSAEAHRAFETYVHNYPSVVAEIADFIACPDSAISKVLRKISVGQVAERKKKPRVVSDREKWLMGQVLMSFEKQCLEDVEIGRRVWEAFHDTYMAVVVWKFVCKEND